MNIEPNSNVILICDELNKSLVREDDEELLLYNGKFVKTLQNEIKALKEQVQDLEQHLKKYTNGDNHKRYYEKNKEKIKENSTNYLQKLKTDSPEKIKEYSHRAYLNKKKKQEAAFALLNANANLELTHSSSV